MAQQSASGLNYDLVVGEGAPRSVLAKRRKDEARAGLVFSLVVGEAKCCGGAYAGGEVWCLRQEWPLRSIEHSLRWPARAKFLSWGKNVLI